MRGIKALVEFLEYGVQPRGEIVVQSPPGENIRVNVRVRILDEAREFRLILGQCRVGNLIQVPIGAGVDNGNLAFDRKRLVLSLLEDLHQARAACQHALRGHIKVGPELGKGRHLPVLRQVKA